jgi:hypothetical protein
MPVAVFITPLSVLFTPLMDTVPWADLNMFTA